MRAVKTLELERDGFGLRELWMLLAAASVIAVTMALVVARGRESVPAGAIGYRSGGTEEWVNALGTPMEASVAWPRRVASQPFAPELGPAQFPSPDGSAIAFVETTRDRHWSASELMVREDGQIKRVGEIASGRDLPLLVSSKGGARSQGGVPLIVSWSPDGSQLAWGSVMEPPYNLHLAERGSWTARSLPLEGGYAGELAWAPGGRYLAISTYAADRTDHTILMLDTAGSESPKRVAKGCVMVWSPDGRHLALHGEPRTQPGLWVVSVNGDARQVIDRLGVAPFAWVE